MGRLLSAIAFICIIILGATAFAGDADYGFQSKRPIFTGACQTCIWGPIGEVVKKALSSSGYDVQVCYSCNLRDSARYVFKAMHPHSLTADEIALGDPPPPDGPVDFGVTNAHTLWFAYTGQDEFVADGPQRQLRLLAFLGDPHYLIIAAKAASGISDLHDIARKKLPVRVVADANSITQAILAYYGLTPAALTSWGGSLVKQGRDTDGFDVIITSHGSLANNLEDSLLYRASQLNDLVYLGMDTTLQLRLAEQFKLAKVLLPIGLLRGVDRPIPTLARNGQAIYGRADMPDSFAYELAKSLDENQILFQYLNRPYFYDVHQVWKTVGDVPLHPGAARYYKERGYIR